MAAKTVPRWICACRTGSIAIVTMSSFVPNITYHIFIGLVSTPGFQTGFSKVVLISVLFWYSYRVVLANKRRDFA